MLNRQRIILALLSRLNRPLSQTAFVKLVFLLRHETALAGDPAFYDFVPYKFGPFSFALYRDLDAMRRDGCLADGEESVAIALPDGPLVLAATRGVSPVVRESVNSVVKEYGGMTLNDLLKSVYARYPWYATRSELEDIRPAPPARAPKRHFAVYTAGYEGRSVDAFFDRLLKAGIELILDVRANPVSRRYGFSTNQFCGIAEKLGIEYRSVADLGIPSALRADLGTAASYEVLWLRYEKEILSAHQAEIDEVGVAMKESVSVLVCMEKDVQQCHRSRLAKVVSQRTGLEVLHL